jgi:hypothetical protein
VQNVIIDSAFISENQSLVVQSTPISSCDKHFRRTGDLLAAADVARDKEHTGKTNDSFNETHAQTVNEPMSSAFWRAREKRAVSRSMTQRRSEDHTSSRRHF